MAKIINSNIESQTINNYYSIWRSVLIGAILGLLFWCLTILLGKLTNSSTIPGDIATILTATAGITTMVYLRMVRPLIVALASALSLWGLAQWTGGLIWYEMIISSIFLYGLAYTLFSWIARYSKIKPVLIVVTVIVIIVRITVTL